VVAEQVAALFADPDKALLLVQETSDTNITVEDATSRVAFAHVQNGEAFMKDLESEASSQTRL